MCEINPKHKKFYRLEAFTSHDMTEYEFEYAVAMKLVSIENQLNEDGRFRFHIHESEENRDV